MSTNEAILRWIDEATTDLLAELNEDIYPRETECVTGALFPQPRTRQEGGSDAQK